MSVFISIPKKRSESRSVVSNSLQLHGLCSPWNSPDQNTGVGSLLLLQGIFPNQVEHGFPTLQADSLSGEPQGKSIPKKRNAKECSNYSTIALISHISKVMLKVLQARLQQYMNCELPDVKLDLEKAEEPEIKLPTSLGSLKKQESATKVSIALLTMPKPLTVWITPKCGKF